MMHTPDIKTPFSDSVSAVEADRHAVAGLSVGLALAVTLAASSIPTGTGAATMDRYGQSGPRYSALGGLVERNRVSDGVSTVATMDERACMGVAAVTTQYPGRDADDVRRNPSYGMFDFQGEYQGRFVRIDPKFTTGLPALRVGDQTLDLTKYQEPSGDSFKVPLNADTRAFFDAYDAGETLTFSAFALHLGKVDMGAPVIDSITKSPDLADCLTVDLPNTRFADKGDRFPSARFSYDPKATPVAAPSSDFCPATAGAHRVLPSDVNRTSGFVGGPMEGKLGFDKNGRLQGGDIAGVFTFRADENGQFWARTSRAADTNNPFGDAIETGCTNLGNPMPVCVSKHHLADGSILVNVKDCLPTPAYSLTNDPRSAPPVFKSLHHGHHGLFPGHGTSLIIVHSGSHDDPDPHIPSIFDPDPDKPVIPDPDVDDPAVVSNTSSGSNMAIVVGFLLTLGLVAAVAHAGSRRRDEDEPHHYDEGMA